MRERTIGKIWKPTLIHHSLRRGQLSLLGEESGVTCDNRTLAGPLDAHGVGDGRQVLHLCVLLMLVTVELAKLVAVRRGAGAVVAGR